MVSTRNIVNGLKKQVGLSTAVSLAGSGDVGILSNIAGNYMANQVFTMSQEKKADELGFQILSESPYNVGGCGCFYGSSSQQIWRFVS